MKTLAEIDNTIDALKDVSTNALSKHGFSRSRQRMVDLSINLSQAWENYKVIHGKTYYKELCLFVINNSASGLKLQSIAKRTGLKKVLVHDCLSLLLADKLIYTKLNDRKLLYCAKKK